MNNSFAMNQPMRCAMCNSNSFHYVNGMARCDYCGTMYPPNVVPQLIVKVEGEVKFSMSDFQIRGGVLEKYHGAAVDVVIPNTVVIIGEGAFKDCMGIRSVKIPHSVKTIGKEAFRGCRSLTSVNIPDSVISIEYGAFYMCGSLTSVNIPNSVNVIEDIAFAECVSLKSIDIPDSVTSIKHSAFFGCSSLTSVDIPDSVTEIGNRAFERCTGLTRVKISKNITKFESAFNDCTNLLDVDWHGIYNGLLVSGFSGTAFEKLREKRMHNGLCPYCGGKYDSEGFFVVAKICRVCNKYKEYNEKYF